MTKGCGSSLEGIRFSAAVDDVTIKVGAAE
jgi:hypothetical protein